MNCIRATCGVSQLSAQAVPGVNTDLFQINTLDGISAQRRRINRNRGVYLSTSVRPSANHNTILAISDRLVEFIFCCQAQVLHDVVCTVSTLDAGVVRNKCVYNQLLEGVSVRK